MKGYGFTKQNKLPSFINRYPYEARKSKVTTLCRCKIHPTLKGVSSVRTLQHLLNFVSSFTLGKAERAGGAFPK
jgi:hypothetical protein